MPLSSYWEVVVKDHSTFNQTIAVISRFLSLTFTLEMNGVGGGVITLDLDDHIFTDALPQGALSTILGNECLWEVRQDGVLRAQFLGTVIKENLLDSSTSQRTVEISGAGPAQVLDWAKVMPPGYPVSSVGYYYWTFTDESLMGQWLDLLAAAQGRGTIPYVTHSFTASADSDGAAWTDTSTVQQENGPSLLDLITTNSTLVEADWYVYPGFQVACSMSFGTDRSNQVIFHEGSHNTVTKTRTRDRSKVSNVVGTQDAVGALTVRQDTTSIATWQRRELYVSSGNTLNAAARDLVGTSSLKQVKDELSSWTIAVDPYGNGRTVFADYYVGDTIGVEENATLGVPLVNDWRIQVIALNIDTEGLVTCELTLQDKQALFSAELQKTIDNLGGSSTTTTGSSSTPPALTRDNVNPQVPTNISGSSSLYFDGSAAKAKVALSWTAPTKKVDNSPYLNGSYFLVSYVLSAAAIVDIPDADWTLGTQSSRAYTTISNLPVGQPFRPRVAAVDKAGNQSDWSIGPLITLITDTAAPPVPTQPLTSSRLGTVSVTWDGTFVGGTARPVDFRQVNVHLSATPSFTPSTGTLLGTLFNAGTFVTSNLIYGTTYYARLVSEDYTGNQSAPSAQATAIPVALVNTDVIGQVISGANIQDGTITASDKVIANTITGTLIAALTIQAGNIAANAIEADKIKAGAIDASKISLGAVGADQMQLGTANLIQDGGFEAIDWRSFRSPLPASASFVSGQGETGGYVLRFTQSVATGSERVVYPILGGVQVVAGQKYYMSARYRGSVGANGQFGLGARWTTRTGTQVVTPMFVAYTAVPTDTTWRTVSGLVTVPADVVLLEPNLGVSSTGTTGTVDVDSVDLRPVLASTAASGAVTEISPGGVKLYGSSSVTGARVELTTAGLISYNSSNIQTVNISAADGSVLITGAFRTAASGIRVEMTNSSDRSTVEFYGSAAVDSAFINSPVDANGSPRLGLNSGPFTYLGLSSKHRLFLNSDGGIQLESYVVGSQNTIGYRLGLFASSATIARNSSVGNDTGSKLYVDPDTFRLNRTGGGVINGGSIYGDIGQLILETQNSGTTASKLTLFDDSTIAFEGVFAASYSAGGRSALFVNTFALNTAATDFIISYGVTMSTRPLVIYSMVRSGSNSTGDRISQQSTTQFTVHVNAGSTDYSNLNYWCYRVG